jgi:hypothetical protein
MADKSAVGAINRPLRRVGMGLLTGISGTYNNFVRPNAACLLHVITISCILAGYK